MVTIAEMKNNAADHIDFAERAAKTVYSIVVVEKSILSPADLTNLAVSNARAEAARTILLAINAGKSEKLDEPTAKRLIRELQSRMSKFIAMKVAHEGIEVLHNYITVLEMVIREGDYEE